MLIIAVKNFYYNYSQTIRYISKLFLGLTYIWIVSSSLETLKVGVISNGPIPERDNFRLLSDR